MYAARAATTTGGGPGEPSAARGDGRRPGSRVGLRWTHAVALIALAVLATGAAGGVVAEEHGPNENVTVSPAEPDVGEPVLFEANESGDHVAGYRWDLGPIDQVTEEPRAGIGWGYEEPGTYTVELEVVLENGTELTSTRNVTVSSAPPNASFVPEAEDPVAGQPINFNARTSVGEQLTYDWSFGDGTTESTSSYARVHTFDEPGEYEVELTVTDAHGETDAVTETVVVANQSDAADLDAHLDATIPESGDGSWSLDASGTTGAVETYWWKIDGSWVGSVEYPDVGTQLREPAENVTLVIEGENATDSVTVEVDAIDVALTDATPVVGQPVAALADTTLNVSAFHWEFGDGAETTERQGGASHVYDRNGTFPVELTVATDDATVTVTESIDVSAENESASIEARMAVNETRPAVGERVEFDATDSEGAIVDNVWDFDDGLARFAAYDNTTYRFVEPGIYEVTYVAIAEDAVDRAHVDVAVGLDQHLETTLTAEPTTVDVDETVTFEANLSLAGADASDAVDEYRWAFGDGTTVTTNDSTATHSYADAGDYTANLTVVGVENATANATVEVESDDGGSSGGFIPAPSGGSGTDDGDEAEFQVADVDLPDDVQASEDVTVTVTIENAGDADDTASPTVTLGGETATGDVDVDAGATASVDLTLTAPDDADDHDLVVETADDEWTAQLSVSAEGQTGDDGGAGSPDDDQSDDGSDDGAEGGDDASDGGAGADGDDGNDVGLPGFGPLAALLGAFGAVLVLARRAD